MLFVVKSCCTSCIPSAIDANCLADVMHYGHVLLEFNCCVDLQQPVSCDACGLLRIVRSQPSSIFCRAVGRALLQGSRGQATGPALQQDAVLQGCQQEPCLVNIAGRAFAQGCLRPQDIIKSITGIGRHLHCTCFPSNCICKSIMQS